MSPWNVGMGARYMGPRARRQSWSGSIMGPMSILVGRAKALRRFFDVMGDDGDGVAFRSGFD